MLFRIARMPNTHTPISRNMNNWHLYALRIIVSCLSTLPLSAYGEFEYKGNVSTLGQYFLDDAVHSADKTGNLSAAFEVELYKAFGDGEKSLVFTPFLRAHLDGDKSSHADIRELLFVQSSDVWEFSLGIGQVFWGVAESRNVVDIINQSDSLEGLGSSAKLGQPMVNLTSVRDWGTLSFYVLPGFRELAFADQDSRPRLPLLIDDSDPQFESDEGASHTDYAMRYSHIVNEWDLGLSYFNGTARTPVLRPHPQGLAGDETRVPSYDLINQIGLDVQATLDSWLLKFEIIRQTGSRIVNHLESVAGFEYSFYGIRETNIDLGVVIEHLWDERGSEAKQHPFQNDLLVGLRFVLNDEQSSEALIGVVSDLDKNDQLITLEASRRLGSSYKLSTEAVFWQSGNAVQQPFDTEDYLQLELSYFF